MDIDNLCQFLPQVGRDGPCCWAHCRAAPAASHPLAQMPHLCQDRVRDFSSMNPKELLIATQRAVRPPCCARRPTAAAQC